jgi:hypothetical protein
MTMDCPRTFPICSVTTRATTSLGPPAGNGTTTLMDRRRRIRLQLLQRLASRKYRSKNASICRSSNTSVPAKELPNYRFFFLAKIAFQLSL